MGMRRMLVVVAVGAALLAPARAAAGAPDATVVRSGDLVATVTHNPFGFTVTQRGTPILTSAKASLGFAVGTGVATQTPTIGYGVFAAEPVVWVHATRAVPRHDGSLLVRTTDPLRSFRLRVTAPADGVVSFDATLTNKAGVRMTGAAFANDARQRFLGFGERSDSVDQTGRIVEQWNEEGPFSGGVARPATDPTLGKQWQGPPPVGPASNFTMPWAISSRGYGFLLDSTWRNRFDLTSSTRWRVETMQPALRWRVYAGPRPTDVLRRGT
jgi:hypothetical protein